MRTDVPLALTLSANVISGILSALAFFLRHSSTKMDWAHLPRLPSVSHMQTQQSAKQKHLRGMKLALFMLQQPNEQSAPRSSYGNNMKRAA